MSTPFFNAQHSPIGAFASFTLGLPGPKGGLGLELGGPANENVFIGAETRTGRGCYEALPFFAGGEDESKRFDVEAKPGQRARAQVLPFAHRKIRRDFRAATDSWSAGDLTFTVYSPVMSVPDPATARRDDLMFALCPCVLAELTLDNRAGRKPRKVFLGYQGSDRYSSMWRLDEVEAAPRYTGVGQGRRTAILTTDKDVVSGGGFGIEAILEPDFPQNLTFALGGVAALVGTVPARTRRTFRFAIAFYRDGIVTAGIDTTYFYTRYFKDIKDAGLYALRNFARYTRAAATADARFTKKALTPDQRFQLAHAVRSYYGSTELLDYGKKPFWVVNEGEYRMMNTFDLTVDQLFFEMQMNPWTVANELDMFTRRYSYVDRVHFPGGDNVHAGGISFTHDMGMANHVSPPHYSTYEKYGLTGCFSHMTHEQLVNWVLCGTVYARGSGDRRWTRRNLGVFRKCLDSMMRRDHPDPAKRNGVMGLDSSRTLHGAEITTYDSLDKSLGQSRNNLYMAVKCWAAYVALEQLFTEWHMPRDARAASEQARRCATTICSHQAEDGHIPAVMGEEGDSRIIPAIEGLAFPWILGLKAALSEKGPHGALIRTLKRHIATVLRPGMCLFEDGGWKLSSTSGNSWLSKIYLAQFVYRKVLGFAWNADGRKADAAHVAWLLRPENAYFAWSDQMVNGVARGSKYYPRGVTAALWLTE